MEAKSNKIELTVDVSVDKAAKLDYGQVDVVISNSGLDRQGETINMEGIDVSQVKRNPVVLWGHDYSNLPIGKLVKIWKNGGDLMGRIEFAIGLYDFADTVYKMVLGGFVNAVSIGGIVKRWAENRGVTDYSKIMELEMVELSVVPVGAHPDALVVAKSLGIDEQMFQKQLADFQNKAITQKMAALSTNEIESSIGALKTILKALEETKESEEIVEQKTEQVETKKKVRLVLTKVA